MRVRLNDIRKIKWVKKTWVFDLVICCQLFKPFIFDLSLWIKKLMFFSVINQLSIKDARTLKRMGLLKNLAY